MDGERLPQNRPEEPALRDAATVQELIGALMWALIDELDGAAAVVSRIVGDLLVDIGHRSRSGDAIQLGHGYLISDFPLTREVIEQREPRLVAVDDPQADMNEAALLHELGFQALLMAPLCAHGQAWALVELYGNDPRRFDDGDADRAHRLLEAAGETLEKLERPPRP